ncbi:DUF4384 domain-containing protein [bacterium]|nr:DUF4384 domain-containing protein [bacterium]
MKTSIPQILFLCVFFFAAALIISCGAKRQPNVVMEKQPQQKQPQKLSQQLTRQRQRQAFAELDEETDETQTPKPGTPSSDFQEKTTRRESESSSVTSPAPSNFSTSFKPLTPEQQKEGWVDAIGEYHQGPDMTTDEAQGIALKQARNNAIARRCGRAISAQTLQLKSETQQDFHESFIQLSQSTVYGKIVDEKEPIWKPVENVQFRPGEPPIPLYCVSLRAKVAKEEGKTDPSFQVTLKLNNGKVTFLEGDEMVLYITPTKDCYITVFNVLSDGTVLILFPPKGLPSSEAKGHKQQVAPGRKRFSIPSEAERQQGVRFRVGLLPGKKKDTEYVRVVATKDDIPFLPKDTEAFTPEIAILKGKVVLPTYKSALEEINRWLVSIPLDGRTFDMQQYEIRKK